MRSILPLKGIAGAWIFLWAASVSGWGQTVDIRDRAVSASRQFVVYAEQPEVRANLLYEAEHIRDAWLQLSQEREGPEGRIILQVIPRNKAPSNMSASVLRLVEGDGGVSKFQLDIREGEKSSLDSDLLRALLLEQIYQKSRNMSGKSIQEPPAWLVEGAMEWIRSWTEPLDADLFLKMMERNEVPRLSDFLMMDPTRLDSTSRAIYRAQSLALLRAILDQPSGRRELHNYIESLATKDMNEPLFLESFSSLGGTADKVKRQWILAVARLGAASRTTPLSARATEEQLQKLLALSIPEETVKKYGKKEEIPEGSLALLLLAKDKMQRPTLGVLYQELQQLTFRSHPFWKSIVEGYTEVCRRLSRGQLRGMERQLKELDALRGQLGKRTWQIESYLDWYEATQLNEPSGEFTETLKDTDVQVVPHTDPISRYLDKVEAQGWK